MCEKKVDTQKLSKASSYILKFSQENCFIICSMKSFKVGSSITLDSRWRSKCSYGKEVYTSRHNGKDMFQASFNYKNLGLRYRRHKSRHKNFYLDLF